MDTVIIDYGSGNLHSAAKAFEKIAREEDLPGRVIVSADAAALRRAARIVLPGQGAFGDCMAGLSAVPGMIEALETRVLKDGVPFLGICVGMQLMAERGLEYGEHRGLGWIPGEVAPLVPGDPGLKIPHMGWNVLQADRPGHPVLAGLREDAHFYFVHSFVFQCQNQDHVLAHTDYGGPVCAAVGRDNMAGVQFHPEKSQKDGLALIAGFMRWQP